MPRNRSAAIVIHNNQLLVMFRKHDREYYTFPGGGVESGETNEQAAIREIYEETSLIIEPEKLVYELHHDNGDIHYYFLCRYLSGVPKVQPGTNEYKDNELSEDIHTPMWLPISSISSATLYPLEVRDQLTIDLVESFSGNVIQFSLKAIV